MQLNAVRTLTVRGQAQGLDRVASELDQVTAAQQGVAQSATVMAQASETSARRQLSAAGAFERLMERNDRMIYLQRQLEREMAVVNRAFEQGAVDAARHAGAVDLVSSKYEKLAADEARARAQITGTTEAIDAQTTAARRLSAANSNGHSFNTANVAAQFQDIGVTAAMGQSPLTIALQQGTQLSAVLGTQGLTGVVSTLGAAFASLLSPVSLITIAAVALGAAGIQAFFGIGKEAEKAADKLKEQKDQLDQLLVGYDKAGEAAQAALVRAVTLPAGVVASDLGASLREQEDAAIALQARIDQTIDTLKSNAEFAQQIQDIGQSMGTDTTETEATRHQIEMLRDLGMTAKDTVPQLQAAMTAARELYNTSDDPAIRDMANQAYTLGQNLLQVKANADAAAAGIAHLKATGDININISIRTNIKEATEGIQAIKDLAPDLRTEYQKVDDQLNATLLANSNLPPMLRQTLDLGARQAAASTKAALDQEAAQKAAEEAARKATTAGDGLKKSYDNIVTGAQQRIDQAQVEAQALGMTEAAAARLKAEHELLNAAVQAGITLGPAQRQQLIDYADKAADAETRTKALTKAHDEEIARAKAVTDALVGAATAIFQPWKDFETLTGNVLSNLEGMGQTNLKGNLSDLLSGKPLGGEGSDASKAWGEASAKLFGKEVGGQLTDFLKNNSGNIGAGLGGLGVGYQSQNPLLGAASGALAGASAGPWGAVIGGIAGFVGGLFGMNEALQKSKKEVEDNRDAIDAFVATGMGKEVSKYASAMASFNTQGQQLIELAKAANDNGLVSQIEGSIKAYRGTLGTQFRTDLNSSINGLSDKGYLNDAANAVKLYNQRLADAKLLGVSAAGASRELSLSFQKIVDEGDLTTKQMRDLARAFPQFADSIERAFDIGQLQDKIAKDSDTLEGAYQRESSALQDVVDRTKDFIESTKEFRSGLLTSNTYSTMDPRGMLAEAQRQFELITKKAQLGDATAQGQLQGSATSYLDAAKGFYGSSAGYVSAFNQVQASLDKVLGSAGTRLDSSQLQLDAMTKQVKHLIDINTSVISVKDAIESLQADVKKLHSISAEGAVHVANAVDKTSDHVADLKAETRQQNLKRKSA